VESDLVGLMGGLNTYGYVSANPISSMDVLGLTQADMRRVWFQALGQFQDLNPSGWAFCGPVSGVSAKTSASGDITVKQVYCDKPCLSKSEYRELFSDLLHESMHSSDSWLRRHWEAANEFFGHNTEHHDSIRRRAIFEMGRTRPQDPPPPGPIWGVSRSKPIDEDALYRQYRKETPGCPCSGGN